MASCMRMGRFKWDRSGYAAFMNTGPVQDLVREKAERVRSAAGARLPRDRGQSESAEVSRTRGKLANGFRVSTHGVHAARRNARDNTLLKSIDAARG